MDDIKRKNKMRKKEEAENRLNLNEIDESPEEEEIKVGIIETPEQLIPKMVTPLLEPVTQIKVSFAKFVQLVATHDFEKILQAKGEEEIVISSNLLADLANAHPDNTEEDKKKFPLFFVGGLIIGIILTYFLVKYLKF